MRQIVVKKGSVINEEVASPKVEQGFILIKVAYSCISAGTEVAGVKNTQKGLIKRALEKPEKVEQALQMLKQIGVKNTLKQIKDLNNAGKPSGYSISGVVIETGKDINHIKPGDRVSAAGGGYAIHAEYVLVPKNLVVKIPEDVNMDEASSATIGAIALHGVRRASLTIGEYGVVIGCGIIGLFTVQILKAAGIKVAAIDIDKRRLEKAKKLGADIVINPSEEDSVLMVRQWSDGMGADAVLFTAAVGSKKPLADSFKMCRKKGKVVLVGTAPIEIDRKDIYTDEIDFLISTSYGPGRYDKNYEEKGNDYPYAFVRWTEKRNIAEFLSLISRKLVDVKSIVDSVFSVEESEKAFNSLSDNNNKPLIVLIEYPMDKNSVDNSSVDSVNTKRNLIKSNKDTLNVAVVGVGSFFKNVHLPNLNALKDKFKIYAVMSHKGYDAKVIAEQNEAEYSTTNYNEILSDPKVDLVFISTRHASHGGLVLQALNAGKHVFVEKPLAVEESELNEIETFYKENENPPLLMVGYNRRYSEISAEIKKAVDKRINPLFIRYRMNAGYLQSDHWVFSEGGRIIGEACHIIDLMQYLIEHPVKEVTFSELTPSTDFFSSQDNKTILLKFTDGSVASIDYFSCGNSKLSKEFMEIHFDQKSIIMDDYKSLKGFGLKINEIKKTYSDKGHRLELDFLFHAIKNGVRPNFFKDNLDNSRITIAVSN